MDEALVEHAEHDIHRDDGGERSAAARSSAKTGTPPRRPGRPMMKLVGQADLLLGLLDRLDRLAERSARRQVERDRRRRKLAEMADAAAAPVPAAPITKAESGTWPLVVEDDDGK